MKKLNFLVVLALFIGLFSSCKKDETTLPAPEVSFLNGVNTASVNSGSSFTIAGTISSQEGLSEVKFFKVTTIGETQLGVAVTSFANANSYAFQQVVNDITSQTIIKVQATDKKNQTTSANFTISITGNAITSYNAVVLGAQAAVAGSSFASLTGTVYQLDQAKLNSSKIDLVFFYGATNNATLSAPSNSTDLGSVFTGTNTPTSWSVQNDTKLEKRTDVVFANVASGNDIPNVQSSGSNKVANIAVGDVIAFRTASTNTACPNKVGVLKINSITGTGATATISFDVKIAL